jgi:hypothetical protein
MVAVLAILVICGWLGRERLLRVAGSLWIVSDPVTLTPLLCLAEISKYGRW